MSESRSYNAAVEISDPEVLGVYFEDFIAGKVAFLPMRLLGIEVIDDTASGPKNPFTGIKEPKLVPELETIVWRSTDQSKFISNLTGLDADNEQLLTLTNGRVDLDPLRIRGHNHPQFNRTFSRGIDLPVDRLTLGSNRSVDRVERIHRPTRLVPFTGQLPLMTIQK